MVFFCRELSVRVDDQEKQIKAQQKQIEAQQKEIESLKEKLNTNSKNSSKPPSRDHFKKDTKKRRKANANKVAN